MAAEFGELGKLYFHQPHDEYVAFDLVLSGGNLLMCNICGHRLLSPLG